MLVENSADERTRVVKRYANRKLYDTRDSRYVTLQQIAELIRQGDEVRILDHRTGQDITSVTMAQIVFEREKRDQAIKAGALRSLLRQGEDALDFLRDKVDEVRSQTIERFDSFRRLYDHITPGGRAGDAARGTPTDSATATADHGDGTEASPPSTNPNAISPPESERGGPVDVSGAKPRLPFGVVSAWVEDRVRSLRGLLHVPGAVGGRPVPTGGETRSSTSVPPTTADMAGNPIGSTAPRTEPVPTDDIPFDPKLAAALSDALRAGQLREELTRISHDLVTVAEHIVSLDEKLRLLERWGSGSGGGSRHHPSPPLVPPGGESPRARMS